MSKDDFVRFGDSLAVNALYIHMTRGKKRIADELSKQFGRFERVIIDVDGERHEFSADSLIRLLESYESYGQVPEQGEREYVAENDRLRKLVEDLYFDLLGEMPESMLEDRRSQMRELGIEVRS